MGHVVQTKRSVICLLNAHGFHVRPKNARYTTAGSGCSPKLKYAKICIEKRAARAARFFSHSIISFDLRRCSCLRGL